MEILIALLIALGLLGSPEDFNNLDQQNQDELIEIVIMDDVNT